MLKKLLVAVLACLTIFLSKRALTDAHAHGPERRLGADHAERDTAQAARSVRTAVLF